MTDRPVYKHNWYLKNKKRLKKEHKRYWQRIRAKVVNAYGGKCEICGSVENLTIDHIKGGGTHHRKTTTYARTIYFYLIKNNYPKDEYRLLCLSCNIQAHWKNKKTLDK